jgi:hypothetical protein
MSTEKQNEANKKNALLSTGPTSKEGKKVVCLNAIKHGIFAKDLIIDSGLGKENIEEYLDLLTNLQSCLNPNNQMETLLVEKIAIDFWRLRRVIRFESGSIRKFIVDTLKDFYSFGKTSNQEIDNEIETKKSFIEWNTEFIECLQKGLVTFDKPIWKSSKIESDIHEDFYVIARNIPSEKCTNEEREMLYNYDFSFEEIKGFVKKHGYSSTKEISSKLIEIYSKQNENYLEDIRNLEIDREKNQANDELNAQICAIPNDDSVDKIMKYEVNIQRSIYQNLLLLKKLQGSF